MKSRFLKTVLLTVVIVGGIWVLFNRDKIQNPGDIVDLVKEQFPIDQVGFTSQEVYDPNGDNNQSPVQQQRQFVTNVIRVASFKINENIARSDSAADLELLADICRRYDAIAFQGIGEGDDRWLSKLTQRVNQQGIGGVAVGENKADYHYIANQFRNTAMPHSGESGRSSILFNRRTLQLDQAQAYPINDPGEVLKHKPLVACFRTRGPATHQAFTFTLVNVKIVQAHPEKTLANLEALFRAIRNDGRGEDDILIVGDFDGGDRELHPMRKRAGLTWVVSNRPKKTFNASQFDNLVFNDVATVEFTGRGGVFDFLRHYNLRVDDAARISKNIPVWAEFSVFEGETPMIRRNLSQSIPGRVAGGELRSGMDARSPGHQ